VHDQTCVLQSLQHTALAEAGPWWTGMVYVALVIDAYARRILG
jgi:hypothetical protein